MSASTARTPAASRRARPARSSAPSSARVYVQPDICNGCGYCVVGCPFGVIDRRPDDGRAFKCTFCYDRQKAGLQPACATACPTRVDHVRRARRAARAAPTHASASCTTPASTDAVVYDPRETSVGGMHAMFIVRGDPGGVQPAGESGSADGVPARRLAIGRRPRRSPLIAGTAAGVRGTPMTATYYDVPLLKAPVWTWEVPVYFFVGGAAGGAAIIGSVAEWSGTDGTLARDARWIAAAGGPLSAALLTADLGRPGALHQHAARVQAAERDVGGLVDADRVLGGSTTAALVPYGVAQPAAPRERAARLRRC